MTLPHFPSLDLARQHLSDAGWSAMPDGSYEHGASLATISADVRGFRIDVSLHGAMQRVHEDSALLIEEGMHRRRLLREMTGTG